MEHNYLFILFSGENGYDLAFKRTARDACP
jgi:hypothetical protein